MRYTPAWQALEIIRENEFQDNIRDGENDSISNEMR